MPPFAVKKTSVQDTVYRILKKNIMSLKLEPGTVMSTKVMAEKMNVSRTPVREAFIRLNEESLVEIIPQRETMVSRIDMERVLQERFIRESLELSVLTPFMKRFKIEDAVRFEKYMQIQLDCQREKRYDDFIDADNEMHHQLFLVARRPLAWDTLQTVNGHDYRFRILAIQNEEVLSGTIEQHRRLISLMKSGEKERLHAELISHLHKIKVEYGELIETHPTFFKTPETEPGIPLDFA